MVKIIGSQEYEPMPSANAENNSLFVDSDDNLLKFKDVNGNLIGDEFIIDDMYQEIDIVEIKANTGKIIVTKDTLFADSYSDADGYRDTVVTGSTDADFLTDRYRRENDGATGPGLRYDAYNQDNVGTRMTNTNLYSLKVITVTLSGGGTYLVKDNLGATIKTGAASKPLTVDLSGDNVIIATGEYIDVIINGFSNNCNANRQAYATTDGVSFSPTNGFNLGNQTGTGPAIITAVTITQPTKIITHTIPTITGTVTNFSVVTDDQIRGAGDDIDFDISDGSTTLTNQTLNTKIVWTGSSNPDELIINLHADTAMTDFVPAIYAYCLKVWKK